MDREQNLLGQRPLDMRFRLAHQISEAVLSVHTLMRVHKNIRPDTILMMRLSSLDGPDDMNLGIPYLTYWSMLRKINAPSSMVGEDDWQKDIYRHPRRQGLQPETRYNMGHDIYSLGVCLLAIGLWRPLVDTSFDFPRPCEEYMETAVRLEVVQRKDISSIQALRAVDDNVERRCLIKLLIKPITMDTILRGMAAHYLPSRMGLAYTSIVVACLRCLDGSFGDVNIFKDYNKQAVGLQFDEKVLQPLTALANVMKARIFESPSANERVPEGHESDDTRGNRVATDYVLVCKSPDEPEGQ